MDAAHTDLTPERDYWKTRRTCDARRPKKHTTLWADPNDFGSEGDAGGLESVVGTFQAKVDNKDGYKDDKQGKFRRRRGRQGRRARENGRKMAPQAAEL